MASILVPKWELRQLESLSKGVLNGSKTKEQMKKEISFVLRYRICVKLYVMKSTAIRTLYQLHSSSSCPFRVQTFRREAILSFSHSSGSNPRRCCQSSEESEQIFFCGKNR